MPSEYVNSMTEVVRQYLPIAYQYISLITGNKKYSNDQNKTFGGVCGSTGRS